MDRRFPSTAALLQRGLDDLRDLGVSGTQGLVRDGDRVTVARSGVADLRTGAPIPIGGYFRMGSTTKTFVSVVLLQLAAEGRIDLEDPIERHLPGLVTGTGNDGRRITVRQILQHTSGLYDATGDLPGLQSPEAFQAHRFDHHTEAQLVATALQHPPLFAPGSHWSYSNTNYLVAGMLIEHLTGNPWSTEMRSRILTPLHLTHTSYPGDRPTLPRPHAEAYQQFAPDGPLVDTTIINPTVAASAGGLITTTADLARFWQALTRGRLLPPAQMADLHHTVLAESIQDLRPGIAYGLGIMWIPTRCGGYWAHFGDMPGVTTLNAVTPDGHHSAVLSITTQLANPTRAPALMQRELTLLDDLICA
ncbi:serine hydrolase domain-containing protein [Winogradskya humida]|uniref:serine hydrolase domain-containing protein n=1 Tax=Winogradskya humida TaxID=113566 RepID=UPI001EF253E3|nr:serine hydrolase domain-containing protein [Actinoplanes humidus]